MGNVASILKVINCDTCAKYVCNAMSINSKCSDCCSFSLKTEEIEVSQDSDSDISVEVQGCFSTEVCHWDTVDVLERRLPSH